MPTQGPETMCVWGVGGEQGGLGELSLIWNKASGAFY